MTLYRLFFRLTLTAGPRFCKSKTLTIIKLIFERRDTPKLLSMMVFQSMWHFSEIVCPSLLHKHT